MSQLRADNYANRLGTKSVPAQYVTDGTAKAWINFDGTGSTNRASLNVSSRTNNGTGDYTVNLSAAMASANYSTSFGQQRARASANWGFMGGYNYAASSARLITLNVSGVLTNYEGVDVGFFGDLA